MLKIAFKLSIIPERAPSEVRVTIQEDRLTGVEGSTIQLQRHQNPVFIKKGGKNPQQPSPGNNQSPPQDRVFGEGHFMGLMSHPNRVSYLEPIPDIDPEFALGVGSDLWHILEIKEEVRKVRNKSEE